MFLNSKNEIAYSTVVLIVGFMHLTTQKDKLIYDGNRNSGLIFDSSITIDLRTLIIFLKSLVKPISIFCNSN